MPSAYRRGRQGEAIAAAWARQRGWQVLATNWRCEAGELDLVALDGDVLVALEVKLRTGDRHGLAEEGLRPGQLDRLLQSLSMFAATHPEHAERLWRVDLLALTLDRGQLQRVTHVPNLTLT
ncbi:MAG: YraN family protein [Thermorudis peleae]|nr:YraN family protein [Thermorudis peleae]